MSLIDPTGKPIAPSGVGQEAREDAGQYKDSGQANKRAEPGEFFVYNGRRIARDELQDDHGRAILPGPAGLLTVDRIRIDFWLVCDLGGQIWSWARSKQEAEQIAAAYHEQALDHAEAEREHQAERAERMAYAKEKRWKGRALN